MNEILSGIRIIKFYAWENAFEDKIFKIRLEELIVLKYMAYTFGVGFTLIMSAAPVILPVLIFYTYTQMGNELDAAKAFTTIALFNVMQFPFAFLPMGASQYAQASVSIKRMFDFFMLEELEVYVDETAKGEEVVAMEGASLSWSLERDDQEDKEDKEVSTCYSRLCGGKKSNSVGDRKEVALTEMAASKEGEEEEEGGGVNRAVQTITDATFSIQRGQLVAVVGSVGSGKSSLLSGLLGDLLLTEVGVPCSGKYQKKIVFLLHVHFIYFFHFVLIFTIIIAHPIYLYILILHHFMCTFVSPALCLLLLRGLFVWQGQWLCAARPLGSSTRI